MRARLVRYGRLFVKVGTVPAFLLAASLAWRHAALAAGLPQTPEQAASLSELVAAAGYFVGLILGTIGITGGVRQLFDGLPDLRIGRFVLKAGVWASFTVGALLALAGYASGRLDVALTGDGPTDLRNLWLLLSLASNYVYTQVYGAGGGEAASILRRLASRGTAV